MIAKSCLFNDYFRQMRVIPSRITIHKLWMALLTETFYSENPALNPLLQRDLLLWNYAVHPSLQYPEEDISCRKRIAHELDFYIAENLNQAKIMVRWSNHFGQMQLIPLGNLQYDILCDELLINIFSSASETCFKFWTDGIRVELHGTIVV